MAMQVVARNGLNDVLRYKLGLNKLKKIKITLSRFLEHNKM